MQTTKHMSIAPHVCKLQAAVVAYSKAMAMHAASAALTMSMPCFPSSARRPG